MTIGLIGYGRFGALACKHIAGKADVVVHDRRTPRSFPSRRARGGTLAEAASQSVVLLAVPISALKATLKAVCPHLKKHALIIDVCSVKVQPLRWMKEILPPDAQILGTHPLFGPDSAAGGLRGLHIVLTPVRVPTATLNRVKRLLKSGGLHVHVMSPAAHDRMMTETIFLTQYVGRLVGHAGFRTWPAPTPAYANLVSIVEIARHDSKQLFRDMWKYNAFGRRMQDAFRRAAKRLESDLK